MKLLDVIEQAKVKAGNISDSQLGVNITGRPGIVHTYRHRNVLPSDTAMIKLCQLADIDPAEGLLWLNIWRSEGPAKKTYKGLLDKLSKSAAAAALLPLVIIGTAPVSEASVVNPSSTMSQVNIMGNYSYGF